MEIKRKPKLKEMLSLAGQVRNWRKLPDKYPYNSLSLIFFSEYEGDIADLKIKVIDICDFNSDKQTYTLRVMQGQTYLYSNSVTGEHEGFEDLMHIIHCSTDSEYRQGHSKLDNLLSNVKGGG